MAAQAVKVVVRLESEMGAERKDEVAHIEPNVVNLSEVEWRNGGIQYNVYLYYSVTQLNTSPTLVYQLTDECRRSCDHLSAISSARYSFPRHSDP